MHANRGTTWFAAVRKEFAEVVLPLAGKPISYVEIGVWAGASAQWVCQNVLTHQLSQGIGVDPWIGDRKHPQKEMDDICKLACDRLSKFLHFELIRQTSRDFFRDSLYHAPRIDCLYLDGLHYAHSVLEDFVLAWPHLNAGAKVIFDDYAIGQRKTFPHVPEAIAAIENCWGDRVKRIGRWDRQAALEIVKPD